MPFRTSRPGEAARPVPNSELIQQAWQLDRSGRRETATRTFMRVLDQGGDRQADACYGLGYLAYERNDLGPAQEWFDRAVRADPRHTASTYMLGLVTHTRGDTATARRCYEAVLRAEPDHLNARSGLRNLAADAPRDRPDAAAPTARPEPPGGEPVPADPAAEALLARGPSGRGAVGQVSALHQRYEPRGRGPPRVVVAFRVRRTGAGGRPLPPVPVELRGEVMEGSLRDGDWVQVPAAGEPGSLLGRPHQVTNLTTGEKVALRRRPAAKGWILALVFVVVAILLIIYVVQAIPQFVPSIPEPPQPPPLPGPPGGEP